MSTIKIYPHEIEAALRNARYAGYCFEARKRMMREARGRRDDEWFVRGMVSSAKTMSRSGVIRMQLARKWLS